LREILRGTGFLLHIPGIMALVSLPVAAWADEGWALANLFFTAVLALAAGQVLVWSSRGAGGFQRYQSMLIAALSWVLIAAIGALPLWLAAQAPAAMAGAATSFHTPAHALFESVSGFTSTGLSVVERASRLPAHIQWWRSLSQWVGGIGVILLLLAILPAERGAINLYFSEAREEKILPTVKSTVRAIWGIYLAYTLLAVGLLWLAGEPGWRALNHGMTAIATGGFTITDQSLVNTPARVQLAYLPIMLAGAVSFVIHYRLIVERVAPAELWRMAELRLLLWVTVGGAALLLAERWLTVGDGGGLTTVFVWVSAITTAGFTASDLSGWGDGPLLMVLLALIMGGMAGSTSGGVKLLRVSLLLKDLLAQLRQLRATPHQVVVLRHDSERVSPERMAELGRIASRLVGMFMLLWLLGVLVMLHGVPADTRLGHVFFDTASALFNSGLATGVAGPGLDTGPSLVLSALMLLGRLEIFPLLVLAAWAAGRR
jgi:trk system potassium uptake protein TrkH